MAMETAINEKAKIHSFALDGEDEGVVLENLSLKKWESKSHMYREAIRVLNHQLKEKTA